MTQTFKVSVLWDTDGQKIDDLPEIVDVPVGTDTEDVADWLSDKYGWCVSGWTEV
jgi:hypothetical protein